jgi:hypothetical protein
VNTAQAYFVATEKSFYNIAGPGAVAGTSTASCRCRTFDQSKPENLDLELKRGDKIKSNFNESSLGLLL